MQWPSDLIGYDALTSYGSPSYYAQVMFSTHLGDEIVDAKLDTTNPRLFESVTYHSKTHHLFVKLVNASSDAQPIQIKLADAVNLRGEATITLLSGTTTEETNSITDPRRIVPTESKTSVRTNKFVETLPRYSIQVLDIPLR
jgi:alpha-N-arabinofuranosidase